MKTNIQMLTMAIIGILSAAHLQAQTACFLPHTTYATNAAPVGCVTGDFNKDNKQDIAVANQTGTVSVLLGVGNGTFGAATNFAAATQPYGLATGDFNADTKLDLAVVNIGSANVSILLGTGTGTFGAPTNFATGANSREVAVADFDGDNKLDLAVIAPVSNNVAVLLGNGNGTFGTMAGYSVGGSFIPEDLTLADFNGDGKMDIATANSTGNNCSVLMGDGFGGFGAANFYATGTGSYGIASGDFNSDTKADLFVVSNGTTNGSVLLNSGNGTFLAATNIALGAGSMARCVKVGDFNSDGNKDVAIADPGVTKALVLLGNGAGGFGVVNSFTVGAAPNYLYVSDFNADGKQDLVVCNQANSNASVLLNNAPTVAVSTTDSLLCKGKSGTLIASGAITYLWSTGASTAAISISPSVTTTYTVTGTSNTGCQNVKTFTQLVDPCLGVQSAGAEKNSIVVAPNPFSSVITVSGTEGKTDIIEIYNVLGERVHSIIALSSKTEIDLGHLRSGIYILKVLSEDAWITTKVIKE